MAPPILILFKKLNNKKMEKEKKVTLEELQKQVDLLKSQLNSLQEELGYKYSNYDAESPWSFGEHYISYDDNYSLIKKIIEKLKLKKNRDGEWV